MLAQQLDLFGATLRPPQKIKEDIPVEPQKTEPPVIDQPIIEQKKISTEDSSDDELETAFPISEDGNDVPEPDDFLPEIIEDIIVAEHEPIHEIFSETGLPDTDWSDANHAEFPLDSTLVEEDEPADAPVVEIDDSGEQIDSIIDEPILADDFEPEEITEEALPALTLNEEGIDDVESPEIIEDEELAEIANAEEGNYLAPRIQQPALRGRKPIHHYDEEAENLRIPTDDILFKRQYYNMRETAAMFGVNQSLLRFWENEFSILQPKKNKKGDRYFRPADIKNLHLIYNLLRVRKFTMEGAKEFLQKNKKAADQFELVNKLDKLRLFLLELKATL